MARPEELVNGPLNVAISGPLIEGQIQRLQRQRPERRKPRANICIAGLTQAQSSIASQLAAVNATSFSVNSKRHRSAITSPTFTGVAPGQCGLRLDQRRSLSADLDELDQLDRDRAADQREQTNLSYRRR